MTINLSMPSTEPDLKPRITVVGVGGAGGNAVNNMIKCELEGVEFIVTNTDAQALANSAAERTIQLGRNITQGLGAGSRPDVGRAAAEEAIDEIIEQLQSSNMVFITAGMGGGTGTGAAPVIARVAREQGILTVGVVTKPFQFEGLSRMRVGEAGIEELQQYVDTLIIIPNQNLFRVANEKTTFAEAFKMADDVLYSGVRGVTDLMVMPGLINLDFADIRQVMSEMGKAMMGTGEAEGEKRAVEAAEAAISNPLLEDVSMAGAHGVLINITGSLDMTLFEVDEAANRIRDEVDPNANIIFGSTFDEALEGRMRISVIATGIDAEAMAAVHPPKRLSLVSDTNRADGAGGDAEPAAADGAAGTFAAPATAEQSPLAIPDTAPAEASAVSSQEGAGTGVETPADDEAAQPPLSEQWEASTPTSAGKSGPGEPAGEPFMPPPPVEPVAEASTTAEPFAAAAMANGGAGGAKARRPSLFERVTGAGRAWQAKDPVTEAATATATITATAAAAAMTAPEGQPTPETTTVTVAEKSAEITPEAAQPKLGELDAPEKGKGIEEDLLDIPAFLRRQAN
ncbi:MAG: cell division protein FtsZ [Proteobacteria bacterium]|nr:cell division protein FtsZ [Pseudomonadota bacterium]